MKWACVLLGVYLAVGFLCSVKVSFDNGECHHMAWPLVPSHVDALGAYTTTLGWPFVLPSLLATQAHNDGLWCLIGGKP